MVRKQKGWKQTVKKCNLCHSIVNDENECHICHNTLTYEPKCESETEQFVWNRYLLIYITKNVWFSVICCVIGLLKIMIARPHISALLLSAVACALISLIVSIFQRIFCKTMTWKYSEDYVPFKIGMWKYLLGGISILIFILL